MCQVAQLLRAGSRIRRRMAPPRGLREVVRDACSSAASRSLDRNCTLEPCLCSCTCSSWPRFPYSGSLVPSGRLLRTLLPRIPVLARWSTMRFLVQPQRERGALEVVWSGRFWCQHAQPDER